MTLVNMSLSSNQLLFLKMAKEITIAKAQSSTAQAYKESGTQTAEFLEEIYKKLCEIDKG